jgi:hypothetical protein
MKRAGYVFSTVERDLGRLHCEEDDREHEVATKYDETERSAA